MSEPEFKFNLDEWRRKREERSALRREEIEAHLRGGGLAIENERTIWPCAHWSKDLAKVAAHLENREGFWGPVRLVTREEAAAWVAERRAAYREKAGPDALTRDELVAALKSRGMTHVRVMSGTMPLDEWRPYGIDGVNGPDNPIRPSLFVLREDGVAVDYSDEELRSSGIASVLGAWSFLTLE